MRPGSKGARALRAAQLLNRPKHGPDGQAAHIRPPAHHSQAPRKADHLVICLAPGGVSPV